MVATHRDLLPGHTTLFVVTVRDTQSWPPRSTGPAIAAGTEDGSTGEPAVKRWAGVSILND